MMKDSNKVLETVQAGFHGPRVLVIGDLVLDRYLWGTVERISPEAPVPVVLLDHESHAVGGAANVAANLSGLGCKVVVAGALGGDDNGRRLSRLLRSLDIETTPTLLTKDRPTICKTRILGGQQQMLRLDVEKVRELGPQRERQMIVGIESRIEDCSAIVLSDYGKGVLSQTICQSVIRRARGLSIPVFVDPKGMDYRKYAGCEVISPNRMEIAAATYADHSDLELLLQKGQQLCSGLGIGHLIVTLGELGIAVVDSSGSKRFPASAREVFDVSGAGDSVIATLCAAVAAGLHLYDAVELANMAAGIVISKVGTVPISRKELAVAVASDNETDQVKKIGSSETLMRLVARWRNAGQRIVFTNGCFDLFHVGHLSLLEKAKREGDRLVVALNTDRSVRALKGRSRPIISQEERARLVAALPCVDAVVLFDEGTPMNLIRSVRPDVLVKGGDYTESEVVGAKEMKEWGGKVVLIPVVEGFSTTSILKRAIASMHKEPQDLVQ